MQTQQIYDPDAEPARSQPNSRKGLILVLIVLGIGLALVFGRRESGVVWIEDYEAAIQRAQEEGKPLLLAFHATWCPPCKRMKRSTYTSPEVIALIETNYIPVLVDIDENRALVSQYKVSPIPAYFLCAPDGTPNVSFVGYHDADAFIGKISLK